MRKELVQECRDKFYVNINGSLLCFGIEEFAIVTGLKCEGEVVGKDFYEDSNRLKLTYFPDIRNVDKSHLATGFLGKKWILMRMLLRLLCCTLSTLSCCLL